jgi:3-phenylpropionate/cinnamic acid dioxygenase small subunit
MISESRLAQLDQLQAQYIYALDSKDMAGWLAQFSADPAASYICTSLENVRKEYPLALILDDCYARLQDRVTYVTKIWAGVFQDYKTRHLTQRLRVKPVDERTFEMLTGFVVYYVAEEDGTSAILTTGEYLDVVRLESSGPRFLKKKVVLDTSVLPHYIIYPL